MSEPGWHRQPDGRERYWDGAEWTDQFRDEVKKTSGGSQSWWEGLSTKKQLVIALVGGFAGLALLSTCQGSGGDRQREYDAYSVQLTCQDLVKSRLVNPSTADFSNETQSLSSATGQVVSENRIGGKVTMNYRCTADGSTVRLVAIEER